jgi:uncharacterized protein (TIGR02246 family)
MKHSIVSIVRGTTFVLASLFLSTCGRTPDEQALIAAARTLDEQWVDAFNRADLDALSRLYWKNPSLLVYPSDGMELRGWDEVRSSHARMLSYMKGATASLSGTRYTVAGDVVVCYGRWTIMVPTDEGPIFEINGRYSDVKAERDGMWVIIMEHGSVPMPPPPDATM